MQGKCLGEFISVRIYVGPAFAIARIEENMLRNYSPHICQVLGGFISVRIHAALVFAPARIQEKIPGELFMYWLRARRYVARALNWLWVHSQQWTPLIISEKMGAQKSPQHCSAQRWPILGSST